MSDPLAPLREALKLSPDNIPLRQHLAESLLASGQPEQAEAEFRETLSRAPDNVALKIGLARAFLAQEKNSAALVILEALVESRSAPGKAHVLYAQLLYRRGEVANAVAQYKLGVEQDADAADGDFAQRLGIGPGYEESEVSDGRVRASWDEGAEAPPAEIDRPKDTLAGVGCTDLHQDAILL